MGTCVLQGRKGRREQEWTRGERTLSGRREGWVIIILSEESALIKIYSSYEGENKKPCLSQLRNRLCLWLLPCEREREKRHIRYKLTSTLYVCVSMSDGQEENKSTWLVSRVQGKSYTEWWDKTKEVCVLFYSWSEITTVLCIFREIGKG